MLIEDYLIGTLEISHLFQHHHQPLLLTRFFTVQYISFKRSIIEVVSLMEANSAGRKETIEMMQMSFTAEDFSITIIFLGLSF